MEFHFSILGTKMKSLSALCCVVCTCVWTCTNWQHPQGAISKQRISLCSCNCLIPGNSVKLSKYVATTCWGFQAGSMVKNPPVKQEMQVQSLGQEDPLEEDIQTHSRILAWQIPWTEETGAYSPWGRKQLDTI